MPAEYDPIVRQYRRSKEMPFREFSEIPDHLALLGDVAGRSVLDLACGEGFYSRLIRRAGAARVVGVDISAGMIALARRQEVEEPLGIEYVERPAEEIPSLGTFDIVSAAYLFNPAPDLATLAGMARSVAGNLRPGGRLVATLGDLSNRPGIDFRAYGMATDIPSALPDGAPYQITFLLDEDTFTITDFAWGRSTIEAALIEAGLTRCRWLDPTISPEGYSTFGSAFWQTYLAHPPVVRLEAYRA